jgi:hypothetical protein
MKLFQRAAGPRVHVLLQPRAPPGETFLPGGAAPSRAFGEKPEAGSDELEQQHVAAAGFRVADGTLPAR